MTRLTASEIFVGSAAGTVSTTIIAVARPTSPSVRTPIGLPCSSRLRPIKPPAIVAAPRRRIISVQSSKAMLPLQQLLRQTSHQIKFVVRPHAGKVGHAVGQREEGGDGR